MATNMAVTPDTPVTIKIVMGDAAKKIKLPLKDLTPTILPIKLTALLGLPTDKKVVFERFSDSVGEFVRLDADHAYKTMVRAAKAKLKLRLRVSTKEQSKPLLTSAHDIPVTRYQPETERKNVGAGIFEFKNAHNATTAKATEDGQDEAPVPRPFTAVPYLGDGLYHSDRPMASQAAPLQQTNPVVAPATTSAAALRSSLGLDPLRWPAAVAAPTVPATIPAVVEDAAPACPAWTIYCNKCDATMLNDHYHCSTCDAGDFDLCQKCVDGGELCHGKDHFLVKRAIKNGQIVASTTMRLSPKPRPPPVVPSMTKPLPSTVFPGSCLDSPKMFSGMPACNDSSVYDLPLHLGAPTSASRSLAHWASAQPCAPLYSLSSPMPLPGIGMPRASRGPMNLAAQPFPTPSTRMPGAFTEETKVDPAVAPTRTCNCCVKIMSEDSFIHCDDCADYDLCLVCHSAKKHGHHPAHSFSCVSNTRKLTSAQLSGLKPGRGVHHFALCDGCDKNINGVRHKCFQCPDFDYCSECFVKAGATHPGHRFATLFEPIPTGTASTTTHFGIYCDGSSCTKNGDQQYIRGVRYKCAICPDLDFCGNCEADPNNMHNKTHPLIKMATPVARLHVSTTNTEPAGISRVCGDAAVAAPVAVESEPKPKAVSSASSVKTVAHIAPTIVQDREETIVPADEKKETELDVKFVSDLIPDGITIRSGARFTQVWHVMNPGPSTWPAGCSVRFVGGDNMFDVDDDKPVSKEKLDQAMESNVIGREVKPNENIAFKVVMKAPSSRDGTFISYWRVKTKDGKPFGDRLWCDIRVRVDSTAEERTAIKNGLRGWPAQLQPNYVAPAARSEAPPAYSDEDLYTRGEFDAGAMRGYAAKKEASPMMIFPTLDKESPASSTYLSTSTSGSSKGKVATAEDEQTGAIVAAATKPAGEEEEHEGRKQDEEEIFQDIASELEVLSAGSSFSDDDDEEEDGFLTDEEYDILDASDQETVA